MREDYSESGDAWNYFTHDQARSRTYRWGEDGLAGISDDGQRLCFALALWNGKDPIIKERLFGLTNGEGNHGKDVKEYYFYLDSTPTHSYMKYLYKYPQAAYPYGDLIETNRSRSRQEFEYELLDTGVFDQDRYFDVFAEYAKASPEDVLIQITICNRGPEAAMLDDIPDAELDRVAGRGFDRVWLLSVWRTGAAGQRVSRENQEWRREFEHTLSDLRAEDIAGSGFAITGYTVHPSLGGDAALARLRERLRARGLRLTLDFVPNHTALDHPWIEDHPEYYVTGTELDLARTPQNPPRSKGRTAICCWPTRDPYFPGWPDTLQLAYSGDVQPKDAYVAADGGSGSQAQTSDRSPPPGL